MCECGLDFRQGGFDFEQVGKWYKKGAKRGAKGVSCPGLRSNEGQSYAISEKKTF